MASFNKYSHRYTKVYKQHEYQNIQLHLFYLTKSNIHIQRKRKESCISVPLHQTGCEKSQAVCEASGRPLKGSDGLSEVPEELFEASDRILEVLDRLSEKLDRLSAPEPTGSSYANATKEPFISCVFLKIQR